MTTPSLKSGRSAKIIRIVIDTQVFLRAAVNRKSLPARVIYDLRDRYELLVSEAIVAEVRDVLFRPKIRMKFPHLDDKYAEQFLALFSTAEMVEVSEVVEISRDPKDDTFLACAKVGNAAYIVSEDKDLLVLNPYENIQIMNVLDFWKILEAQK